MSAGMVSVDLDEIDTEHLITVLECLNEDTDLAQAIWAELDRRSRFDIVALLWCQTAGGDALPSEWRAV